MLQQSTMNYRQMILLFSLTNCMELSAWWCTVESVASNFQVKTKDNICLTLLLTINPNCDVA